jgi:hypothetical protein
MHGDEHKFSIIDNLAQNYDWEYFTEIQVAQGAKADPLLVTVVMAKNEIMEPIVAENGIQTIVGNGLFLIDQQGGCYDEGVAKNGIMEPPVGENGMQTIVGKGLFRIDQQGGFYDEGDC